MPSLKFRQWVRIRAMIPHRIEQQVSNISKFRAVGDFLRFQTGPESSSADGGWAAYKSEKAWQYRCSY